MSKIQDDLRPSIQTLLRWAVKAENRLRNIEQVTHELQRVNAPNLSLPAPEIYLNESDLERASQTTEALETFLKDRVGL